MKVLTVLSLNFAGFGVFYVLGVALYIYAGGISPLHALDTGLVASVEAALLTQDWGHVRTRLARSFGLGATYTIIGNASDVPLFELQRGNLVDKQTRVPVASASKLVSAAAIQCVVVRTAQLNASSRPAEFFDWWTADAADPRAAVTLQSLLLFESGLRRGPAAKCHFFVQRSLSSARASLDAWEACVRGVYELSEASGPPSFDYGGQHLLVAGLMAVKAYQRHVAGAAPERPHSMEEPSWDDLLDDCIVQPSGITPSPRWHRSLPDGRFGYDTAFDHLGPSLFGAVPPRNPHFPVALDAALGASPEQYGRFLRALLAGELFTPRPLRSYTVRACPSCDEDAGKAALRAFFSREDPSGALAARGHVWGAHGLQPDRARHPLASTVAETPYARGSWLAHPEGAVHSLGAFGTCPWVDMSSPDQRQHHYGVIFGNSLDRFNFHCFLPALGVLLALTLAQIWRRSDTDTERVTVWFCDVDCVAAAASTIGIATFGFAFLLHEWPAAVAIVSGAVAGQRVSWRTKARRVRNDRNAIQLACKLAPLGMLLTAAATVEGAGDLGPRFLVILGFFGVLVSFLPEKDRIHPRIGPKNSSCSMSTGASTGFRKRLKLEAAGAGASRVDVVQEATSNESMGTTVSSTRNGRAVKKNALFIPT
jgi:hypothetical protein